MVGKAPDPNSDSPVTEKHIEYAINEIGKAMILSHPKLNRLHLM